MKMRCLVLSLALGCAVGSVGWAIDSIKTSKGLLYGEVVGMDSVKVDLQKTAGSALQHVPVNEIQTIFYQGESPNLKIAKNHVLGGHYAEAVAALERIKDEPDRPEVQQDIEFYKALCAARLAMAGNMKIGEAGRKMKEFADTNAKSYHYF